MEIRAKSTSRRENVAGSGRRMPICDDEAASVGRMTISTFSTPLGWMGLLGQDDRLVSVFIGRATMKSI